MLQVSMQTLNILQSHYPERLGMAVCYHAPRLFSFSFKVHPAKIVDCASIPMSLIAAAVLRSGGVRDAAAVCMLSGTVGADFTSLWSMHWQS